MWFLHEDEDKGQAPNSLQRGGLFNSESRILCSVIVPAGEHRSISWTIVIAHVVLSWPAAIHCKANAVSLQDGFLISLCQVHDRKIYKSALFGL